MSQFCFEASLVLICITFLLAAAKQDTLAWIAVIASVCLVLIGFGISIFG